MHLLHTSKTSTSLLTMKLLLCFSTENPRGLCASFDVSEWQPSCFEQIRSFLEAKGSEAQELETGCSPFSIMESQGLYCFMLFYLIEGI